METEVLNFNPTTWIDLLPFFCLKEGEEDFTRPFSIEFGGEKWTIATDGRALAMLPGEHARSPAANNWRDRIAKLHSSVEPFAWRGDIKAIRDWCGEPFSLKPVECRSCMGTGETTCPHCEQEMDCENCGGEGEYVDSGESQAGVLCGVLIDRTRLSHMLRIAAGEAMVSRLTQNTGDCLLLRGDGWRVLLMALTPGGGRAIESYPAFE